ncbi:MAG: PAS domain-containing protein [Nitrospira sp.]|nr:PAS domain S-box protein [Candidatus Manganitrophaceae bacterium]HIL33936.1 PAS domain S-box protein [Candidatus Manganitrophaceae bacterium]
MAFSVGISFFTVFLVSYLHFVTRKKEELTQASVFLQAEINERKETETRLTFALDASISGAWDWNVVTGEVVFSPRWFQMLEYEPDELEMNISTWGQLMHPDDKTVAHEKLEDHLEGKTDLYECQLRLHAKSGRYLWSSYRGKVIARDPEGKPLRMVCIDTDISMRKEKEDIHRASEERYQTIFNASHDAIF